MKRIRGNTELNSKVVDTKTGLVWNYLGWTYSSQSNYSCAIIERDGLKRKLSLFADKGSSRDINRYEIL